MNDLVGTAETIAFFAFMLGIMGACFLIFGKKH